jgi:hypothetical protein
MKIQMIKSSMGPGEGEERHQKEGRQQSKACTIFRKKFLAKHKSWGMKAKNGEETSSFRSAYSSSSVLHHKCRLFNFNVSTAEERRRRRQQKEMENGFILLLLLQTTPFALAS